ncbi:MAG: hypothetical protein ACRD2L_24605, partial [Terriglobia bacterium]
HETEVSEGVQEEDREQDGPRFQLVESRENVDPCGDPEHQRADQEIDGQDVHQGFDDRALPYTAFSRQGSAALPESDQRMGPEYI